MNRSYLVSTVLIAALGAVLFGISMGAVAGAATLLEHQFGADTLGFTVSILVIGCMLGAFTFGPLSDKIGRKPAMIILSLMFVLSFAGQLLCANSLWLLRLSRLIGGLATGACSVVIPTYISEISPDDIRGKMGSMFQFGVVIGIIIAYAVDYFVQAYPMAIGLMLGQGLPWAVLYFFLLIMRLPESPQWLINQGREHDAQQVFKKISPQGFLEKPKTNVDNSYTFKNLLRSRMKFILLLGVCLAAFQQITGINAVIFYAPKIFAQMGAGEDALISAVIIGSVNFVFTIVAIPLVDRLGRKQLLIWGGAGMSLTLSFVTFAYGDASQSVGLLIALMGYIAFFAATWGPVMWIVTSELYPTRIRGMAMSVSTAVSWMCTIALGQFFPTLLANFGGGIFAAFGLISAVAAVFTFVYIPETKGKSLREIQQELQLESAEKEHFEQV